MNVSCHRSFLPDTSLEPAWSPLLRLQASHCSTFRIMCDVPCIAVFCSESIECFPGTASKFFPKLLVTIPVVPIITGTIVHFRFHIRCISIHKLLYFNSFSASFCTTFLSAGIATSISVHVFPFFVFNYYIWPICCNFSVCVYVIIIIIIIIIIRWHCSPKRTFVSLMDFSQSAVFWTLFPICNFAFTNIRWYTVPTPVFWSS